MGFYEGGHMMYMDRHAHGKLKTDLSAFIKAATPPQPQ